MNETEKDKTIKDEKDKNFVFLKIQKLTTAIYLVSGFIPDQEPLKWKLRDLALEILMQAERIIRHHETDFCLFEPVLNSIGQLLILINVALTGSNISQMNFSLLKTEYQNLQSFLSSGAAIPLTSSTPSTTNSPLPSPKSSNKLAVSSFGQNQRQETIIKYLKQHGQSSIKDIAHILPQVSSKTVQRELADLIQAGVIQREGDRRWSRYNLTTNHR